MFFNILNKKRFDILPKFKSFKKDFYLAGGTGLALQLGHRDSVDFDFFTQKDIGNKKLFLKIKKEFVGHSIIKVQDERNTLTAMIDGNIKVSFFNFSYELIDKKIETDYFYIASIRDIACMKIWAIVNRATNKDYIDLYFILKQIKLEDILKDIKKKLKDIDINLVFKSLLYFQDIIKERIMFRNGNDVDFKVVKNYILKEVKKLN